MDAEARTLISDIRISTVLPRSERIDALNAGLVEMCTAEGLTLINNEETFKLEDGSINDGYYLDDGTHLTMAGTNLLDKNLKVNLMPGQSKDITKNPVLRDISRPQHQQPTRASHGVVSPRRVRLRQAGQGRAMYHGTAPRADNIANLPLPQAKVEALVTSLTKTPSKGW